MRQKLFPLPLPTQHHQILFELPRTIPAPSRHMTPIACRPEQFRPLRGRAGAWITLHASDGCMRKMG